MPVIPATMLPQPPGGSARYARAEMPGVRFQARASAGTAALSAAASALPDLAGKVAGLWFQANLKAKEAKAAMDLDEIRVRAEAAHRDGMRELAQDPDGYETFGDRSQKAFLALRQDCRELLDGLPPEHRRRAELYLTGQAARWRDDTSRLQYQARVTALDARAKGSIEGQLDAADWDGARATAQSALDSQVWSRARYDAAMADIGHREAFAAKLAEVKARPADFTGLADAGEDGKWTMEAPGLTAQDRERQAAHARALCGENAREMRERYMAAMDAGEPFDTAEFSRAADGGRITRDQADGMLRVARGREAKAAHDAFELSLADGSLATPEKVDEAEKAVRADKSLPDAERAWRLERLGRERLRLEAASERAATRQQSENLEYLKFQMAQGETYTDDQVREFAESGRITYSGATELLGRLAAERTAAERRERSRLAVDAWAQIEDLEVPDTPEERLRLFQAASGNLFAAFYAEDPDAYRAAMKQLQGKLGLSRSEWRENATLVEAWKQYQEEQEADGYDDFYSQGGTKWFNRSSHWHERDRSGEMYRQWKGTMAIWLEHHPSATEEDMRKYGDALLHRIHRQSAADGLQMLIMEGRNIKGLEASGTGRPATGK